MDIKPLFAIQRKYSTNWIKISCIRPVVIRTLLLIIARIIIDNKHAVINLINSIKTNQFLKKNGQAKAITLAN